MVIKISKRSISRNENKEGLKFKNNKFKKYD